MEITNKEIERIEREGDPNEIWGIKSCKSYKSYLQKRIEQHRKKNNLEVVFILTHLFQAYEHFHPEKNINIEAEQWQGKSSIEIFKGIDNITIVKYQKKDKDSEPEEVKLEVLKKEIQDLYQIINKLYFKEPLETRTLARAWCISQDITKNDKGESLFQGLFWEHFFNWRKMHNKFTLMLNVLDKVGLIKYSGGKTTLLKRNVDVQTIL